jgi:hypothetical protein
MDKLDVPMSRLSPNRQAQIARQRQHEERLRKLREANANREAKREAKDEERNDG